ncbi:hypothetical protein ACO2Q3_20925 [Caulobacter sp. KR2-114]|uniref:hypothetical protein n=1 Tax=Caulobacter sp. KR2-114 TaxID=3400912 RepID=UPI003C0650B4
MIYRAFSMTTAGGYAGWTEITADSDEAALAQARRQSGRRPVDLWCGGRFVGRIEHGDVEPLEHRGERDGGGAASDAA